jgi:hypothetical protein
MITFTHSHENNAIPADNLEIEDFHPGLEKKSFKMLTMRNPNTNPKNIPLKRIFIERSNSGGKLRESASI